MRIPKTFSFGHYTVSLRHFAAAEEVPHLVDRDSNSRNLSNSY